MHTRRLLLALATAALVPVGCGDSGYSGGTNGESTGGGGYTSDVDCAEVGQEIVVSGNDPNGLDADNDGIGCEGW